MATAVPLSPAPRVARDTAAPDEVVRAAVAVFGDSIAVAAADSAAAEPQWDIDVRSYETHDRVAHYVNLFSTSAKERFRTRLSAGTRYEPMIRAKLRASGMPEDLTYLALIESGYDPHAYSRAAAVGMWQFMSSTAKDIGMRVDWWVDERRDPARATDGAIRFLGYLQKQFGSFYLAAAAYNGGPGRVSRGLTRFAEELEGFEGEDRFFALADQDYLRAETKNYVPQLIAAALIAKTPDRYGIVLDSMPLYLYDSVSVAPGTSLAAVSRASGVGSKDLRYLNPALLRGMAPPDASVWVRLPEGTGELTRAALDTMTDVQGFTTSKVTGTTTTASGLAGKHGITVKQLRWFNPNLKVSSKGRLTAGQTVRIPDGATLAYAFEIPDPSIERYGTSSSASLQSRGVHVVRRGETLGGIARRYGMTQSRLQAMNGMRGTRLVAGQSLQVRGATTASSKTTASKTTKSAAKASTKTSAAKSKGASSKASKSTKAKATSAKSVKAKSATTKKKTTKAAPKSASKSSSKSAKAKTRTASK
ncbi:MAG TPA: transglycosylase SLT domain-containing protein [Gemmatimonas sp.]|uniref:lytic transglycosylase domain-containing protein n=1 Tax=Gemmatimonas sp. TaxID=1962908 RepID=UPI002EDAEDEB